MISEIRWDRTEDHIIEDGLQLVEQIFKPQGEGGRPEMIYIWDRPRAIDWQPDLSDMECITPEPSAPSAWK